jgi:hypothetical protein
MNEESSATTIPGSEDPDVGSRISRAFAIYWSHPIPFLILALINLPLTALEVVWEWGLLVAFIPGLFVGEFVTATISYTAYQRLTAKFVDVGQSVGTAGQRFAQLAEFTARYYGAGLLLCLTIIGIPWGIRLLVRWGVGTQGIVLYGDTASEAISRSARLVEGQWWRVFGNTFFAFGLIGFIAVGLGFIGGTVALVTSVVWGTLATPFSAIFMTLLFLRLSHEKGEAAPPNPTFAPR